MRRVLAIGMMVCALGSALCRAESVSLLHTFNTMKDAGTLTFPDAPGSYAVGVTDFVTYTGSNGGQFGMDGSLIAFSLPTRTSTLVISPAVQGLSDIYITQSAGKKTTWIKVYISEDGSSWTDMSDVATYSATTIDLILPTAGNYYVKLVNDGTSSPAQPVFLRSVRYTYDPTPCNCFPYIAP